MIPDSAALLMILKVFLIGFVMVIFLLLFMLVIIRLLNLKEQISGKKFIAGLAALIILNFIFILIQENPLINYYLALTIAIVCGLLLYHVYYVHSVSVYNYVYIAIAGFNNFDIAAELFQLRT